MILCDFVIAIFPAIFSDGCACFPFHKNAAKRTRDDYSS